LSFLNYQIVDLVLNLGEVALTFGERNQYLFLNFLQKYEFLIFRYFFTETQEVMMKSKKNRKSFFKVNNFVKNRILILNQIKTLQ
jgi:hypothetical protein